MVLPHSTLQSNEKILFCVLNWGLGHASRSIPIIQQLLSKGHHIHIASDGVALELLRKELPQITYHTLPSYNIRYSGRSMSLNIIKQLPKIGWAYLKENKVVRQLVKKQGFTTIISDHRYGCRSHKTTNVFIGHQIRILQPSLQSHVPASELNRYLIGKFDACWIPDFNDNKLSGNLSNIPVTAETHYLGISSRLSIQKTTIPLYDTTIILSGPEPARTVLEHKLLTRFSATKIKVLLIRGTQEPLSITIKNDLIETIDLADHWILSEKLSVSKNIICRSGYSTLMDLYPFDFSSIELIPTEGQSEQLYLAKRMKRFYPDVFVYEE